MVTLIEGPLCGKCGRPLPPGVAERDECRLCRGQDSGYETCRGVWSYEGPAEDAIKAFKYGGKPYFADFLGEVLHGCLLTSYAETLDLAEIDAIAPVPIHIEKRSQRGYHHTKLLADAVSIRAGIPCAEALIKVRQTRSQAGLKLKEREENVAGAFEAVEAEGKALLLIDDVYTTGATVRECSRTLRAGGAASVRVLTLARRDL